MARRNALSVNDVVSRVLSVYDESDTSDIFEGIIYYNSKQNSIYNNITKMNLLAAMRVLTTDLNGKFLHKYTTSTYNNIDNTTQSDIRDFDTESENESYRSRSPLSDEGTPLHLYCYFIPNHE